MQVKHRDDIDSAQQFQRLAGQELRERARLIATASAVLADEVRRSVYSPDVFRREVGTDNQLTEYQSGIPLPLHTPVVDMSPQAMSLSSRATMIRTRAEELTVRYYRARGKHISTMASRRVGDTARNIRESILTEERLYAGVKPADNRFNDPRVESEKYRHTRGL